jgi:hypothetical protein
LALGVIAIPSNVATIGDSAFAACTSLASVDLGSVDTIGNSVFQNCTSLTSVDLGSVNAIGVEAFASCTSLNSITYTRTATPSLDTDLVLIDKNGSTIVNGPKTITRNDGGFLTQFGYVKTTPNPNLVCLTRLALGAITIPSNVTVINVGAFSSCASLTSVDLGSVTGIGHNVFLGCTSLTSIDLGSVATIGNRAFLNCTSLASIDLSSATTIGIEAFANCTSLTSVDLGSVNTIVGNAFARCPSLNSITYQRSSVATNDTDLVLVQSNGAVANDIDSHTITRSYGGFLTQ